MNTPDWRSVRSSIDELESHVRILECKNRILHNMLKGEKVAVCQLNVGDTLRLNHSGYTVERDGWVCTIKWT